MKMNERIRRGVGGVARRVGERGVEAVLKHWRKSLRRMSEARQAGRHTKIVCIVARHERGRARGDAQDRFRGSSPTPDDACR